MKGTCRSFVAACFLCQLEHATHDSGKSWRRDLIAPPPGPRMEWVLDLLVDLPCKGEGPCHVLTAVGPFSKFTVLVALSQKSAAAVMLAF